MLLPPASLHACMLMLMLMLMLMHSYLLETDINKNPSCVWCFGIFCANADQGEEGRRKKEGEGKEAGEVKDFVTPINP